MKVLLAYLKEVIRFRNLPQENRDLIFFSEGKQYFSTFEPILRELSQRGQKCCILTMSQSDPIFTLQLSGVASFFIGGNSLSALWMNLLSAKLVVMTTPNLHCLNIKRSPGVQHYSYLFHALTSCGLYKAHAFDHFDSILCVGKHHEPEIRGLEQAYQTHKKQLYQTGFPHLDFLLHKKLSYSSSNPQKVGQKNILIAGTWGKNSCLERYGKKLIEPLIEKGHFVTVRPHPQMQTSNPTLLKDLKKQFANSDLVTWDHDPDGMQAMLNADLMVSDLSGIIFDFAFLCQKPIICIESDINTQGTEIQVVGLKNLWEIKIRKLLGKVITENELHQLGEIVDQVQEKIHPEQITQLMNESLYNVGKVGSIAASQIIEILESI